MPSQFEPIPIQLVGPDGRPTEDFVDGQPCVNVSFALLNKDKIVGSNVFHRTVALIDTGATLCVFDEAFLDGADATSLGDVPHETVGVSDTIEARGSYNTAFTFDRWPGAALRGVAIAGRINHRMPWRIIIGRNLLKQLRCTFDRGAGCLMAVDIPPAQ